MGKEAYGGGSHKLVRSQGLDTHVVLSKWFGRMQAQDLGLAALSPYARNDGVIVWIDEPHRSCGPNVVPRYRRDVTKLVG